VHLALLVFPRRDPQGAPMEEEVSSSRADYLAKDESRASPRTKLHRYNVVISVIASAISIGI